MALPRVLLSVGPDAVGVYHPLVVEVARTPVEIERGLSGRPPPIPGAEQAGMLFDLGAPGHRLFWMRGVAFPLDMIFLDGDGIVRGMHGDVPAGDPVARGILEPYSWVLEAPGGWARRHGVRVGQRVVALIPLAVGRAPAWTALEALRAVLAREGAAR